MKDSICRFLPTKNHSGDIKTVHFVYETDIASLKQPFIRPIYYAHPVTSGEATLRYMDKAEHLTVGTLFFFFPAGPYEITDEHNLKYIYISFMGSGVQELLENIGVNIDRSVFPELSHLHDMWMRSIARVDHLNGNILTESVLLYTLSYIPTQTERAEPNRNSENLFEMIVSYVDAHFREPDITLRSVSDIFSYSEKYLSHFFKSRMNVGFNEYLNNLRFQYAHKLISEGHTSVSEIAVSCGFCDPLYFSKFFKKRVGHSPSEYISMKSKGML